MTQPHKIMLAVAVFDVLMLAALVWLWRRTKDYR